MRPDLSGFNIHETDRFCRELKDFWLTEIW